MSALERLVAGVLVPGFAGAQLPPWVARALDAGLPGVCLYGQNAVGPGALPGLAGAVRAGWPGALVAVDEEGGDVTRLEYLTGSRYPGNAALGAVDDVGLTHAVGRALAADLRACGATVDLVPSVDVASDPRNPVIGTRSFGADPALVARHGAAMVRGLQDGGVAAVAKHFPGHGATVTDSHHALPVLDVDEATFRARDLPPFAAAVEAGALGVMTSHVVFTALDADEPATLSRRLLVGLLREELGFDGAVVTDALDMAAVRDRHGLGGAAVRAVVAGADVVLLGTGGEADYEEARAALLAAAADGTLRPERLEEAAWRAADLAARAAALVPVGGDDGPADGSADGSADGPAGASTADVGLAAARRAVRCGAGLPLDPAEVAGGVLVVEVRGRANMAVGEAAWGLAGPLAGLMADDAAVVEAVPLLQADGAAAAADRAAGRALVIAVRDAFRTPWQAEAVRALLAARPDAVLIGLGPAQDADLARDAAGEGARWVVAWSASAASARAAAEVLLGR